MARHCIVWFLIKSSDLPALKRKGGGGSKTTKIACPKFYRNTYIVALFLEFASLFGSYWNLRLSKQFYPYINPKKSAQVQNCYSVYCKMLLSIIELYRYVLVIGISKNPPREVMVHYLLNS
jgi:hypothetical protein